MSTLDVQSPADCSSRADVIARVSARSPRVRFTRESAPFAIRVDFERANPSAVTAEITIARAGSKSTVRTLRAASCTDAADAVAIIVGVALDPTSAESQNDATAATTPDAGASTVERGEPTAAKDTNTAGHPPARATGKRPDTESPSAPSPAPSVDPVDPLPTEPIALGFAAFALANAAAGPAPALLPGFALYGRMQFERSSELAPALGLGASHAERSGLEAWGGNASFSLNALTVDACLLRFTLRAVTLRACGSTLLGHLNVTGSDTRNPAEPLTRPFVTLGGTASADLPLGSLFAVTLRLSVESNLIRDEFQFYPRTFHQVPPATFSLGLGVGVHSD